MTRPLAHHCTRTRTFRLSHSMFTRTFRLSHSMFTRTFRHAHNQSLAHRPTRTFHVHSHIMTGPLAHYDWTTCTSLYSTSHIPCSLANFDTHITNHSHIALLAHSMFTRTFRHAHNQSLAHYDRTTRTSPHSHVTVLAHFDSPITNHSHIVTGTLAHWPN